MANDNLSSVKGAHSGSMNQLTNEEIENLSARTKYTYDVVNKWIENSDSKISVSCAVLTIAFGVFTFVSERWVKIDASLVVNPLWQVLANFGLFLSMLAMGAAIVAFCFALIPNLKSTNNSSSKKCPIFFGDIASLAQDEYKKKAIKASEIDFISELLLEIHINTGICLNKMKLYRLGMVSSIIAIFLAIATFITRFFIYHVWLAVP